MTDSDDDNGLDELLEVGTRAAIAGADTAMWWSMKRDRLEVRRESTSSDLVSQADHDAEAAVRAISKSCAPITQCWARSWATLPGTAGVCWAVDPIDGTTEYLYDRSNWAVSVAAMSVLDGTILCGVVTEPATGRTTVARLGGGTWCEGQLVECRKSSDLALALVEVNLGAGRQREQAGDLMDALVPRVRDLRDCGSAACALAAVAAGRVDAYWGPGLQVWDGGAGILLVNEAGGATGGLNDKPSGVWPATGNVLAANHSLREQLSELLDAAWNA